MTQPVNFYYDVASPYSYLAASRINRVAEKDGVTVVWKPILLGGIFHATGNTMPAAVPARGQYLAKDLVRWAERDGIPFQFSSSFPHNSLLAMRVLTAADSPAVIPISTALFRAAWAEDRDIANPQVVAEILGNDAERLLAATQDPTVKERLKKRTQEAIDAGAFGAPSFVVGNALFWGNDRLEMAVDLAAQS